MPMVTPAPITSALITPGGGTWQVTTDHGRTDVVAPGGTHTTLDTSSVDAVMSALGDDIAVLERRSGELNWPATKSTVLLSSEIESLAS